MDVYLAALRAGLDSRRVCWLGQKSREGHLGRNRHSVFALKDRPQSGRAVAAAHGCPGRPLFNGSMSATRGPEWKPGAVYSLGMKLQGIVASEVPCPLGSVSLLRSGQTAYHAVFGAWNRTGRGDEGMVDEAANVDC
jgi:hypothetical protein